MGDEAEYLEDEDDIVYYECPESTCRHYEDGYCIKDDYTKCPYGADW